MSEFYDVDSTRVSHREYWWGTKSPLVLIGWLIKWLHIRIPGSTDDPNVDSTLPFVTEALPPDIAPSFEPLTAEIAALGFSDPVYHVIWDPGTQTKIFWATFRHSSGKHFARIHRRVWHRTPKASRALFPMFFTAFSDGTFLVSSAGKPDLATPPTAEMIRMHGAKTPALWAAHERWVNAVTERKLISPVNTREDLVAASERHHLLLRDFNLGRGVFRPRSAAEQAKADAFAASVAQAEATGQENAEVLAELERLQQNKPGWSTAVWVLVGSLVAFVAAGAAKWDWKFTLWIIPVVFFHELGHWLAMRLFRYRNLRMFFIPLFGAAVMGQHWNVPGWKKALVSLAGPLPGIAVGVVMGVAGMVLGRPWLNEGALVLLFVNGLNLLPVLPLDGGHVLQDTLFCRNRWLDGAFRALAIFGVVGLGILLGAKLLAYLAIPMAIAVPVAFKLGKVTDAVRRQPLPPPLPGEDRIPIPTAQAIIGAIRAAFPPKLAQSNKALAQHTLTVFERLNARPPGILATLAFLLVQGGAFFLAVLVSLLLVINKHGGGLKDFMAAAVRQPRHSYQPGDVEAWGSQSAEKQTRLHTRIVATLPDRAGARNAFAGLTNRLPPAATLTRLADSLVLSIPAGDDTARERCFDEMQAFATNTFVALSNAPVMASLICIARTETEATNLTRELGAFFSVAGQMRLIAPWSPEAQQAEFASWRLAREQWSAIEDEVGKAWRDPAVRAYSSKISVAMRRGATGEAARLVKEREAKAEELQARAQVRLRTASSNPIDPALLNLYARLHAPDLTNYPAHKALLRELAGKLGEVKYAGDRPGPGADAWSVTSGIITQHGLLVEARWIGFCDPARGLPAMADWLDRHGCSQIKYDLEGSGWVGGLDEPGE